MAASLAAFDAALAALTDLARSCGAVFVRIEPVDAGFTAADADAVLRSRGLRPAPANQQPELTWIVDLDRDFKDVLADMKPVNRNLYRNIHKKGVTFRSSQDPQEISILLGFLHLTAARNGFKPQSDDYLTQVARSLMPAGAATLFIAELEGEPIAAALAYDSADTRTYAHAALDDAHRKLSAGIPLLVTLMADAKDKGLKQVDLWGVAPADQPDHKWAGFTCLQEILRRARGRLPRNLGPAGEDGALQRIPAGPEGCPGRPPRRGVGPEAARPAARRTLAASSPTGHAPRQPPRVDIGPLCPLLGLSTGHVPRWQRIPEARATGHAPRLATHS